MISTPAYMAPEQFQPGGSQQLDGKADVALGIMLYEMLGRLPYTAEHSFDYMVAHVRGTRGRSGKWRHRCRRK